MNSLQMLYHLVHADYLERMRRSSFVITLAVTLWLGVLLIPPLDAGYVAGVLPHEGRTDGNWCLRGFYNSAWVGTMVALLASLLLSLPGFFLVKGTVERDRRTGVGEILATTPLRKPCYTLGKWLGNLALLATMVGALVAAALAMQIIRGEVLRVELWVLLSPFLLIALPVMAVVAALAVLFDTIPWLRGGVGNVAVFALWTAAMVGSSQVGLFGMNVVVSQVNAAARAAYPDHPIWSSVGINPKEDVVQILHWEGVRWTAWLLLQRLSWVGLALGLALVAALPFDRFDPARRRRRSLPKPAQHGRAGLMDADLSSHSSGVARVFVSFLGTPTAASRVRFWPLLLGELRLAWKAMPWWWYVAAVGLAGVALTCPLDASRQYLLPLAWFWPLLIWSAMGIRETRHGTGEMVFSTAYPLRCGFPALWLAGVNVSLLTGMGTGLRLALAHEWSGLLAWAVGALFIPSLALALGTWSGSSKPFEALYTVLWYVGPMNGLAVLDFMGALPESTAAGAHWTFLGATVVLVVLAALGRWRQVRR
jgi:hypothetical protein